MPTWSLAEGVDLFTRSRRMGTSLAMIDATYGHLARTRTSASGLGGHSFGGFRTQT
jgi:hypothetical protein